MTVIFLSGSRSISRLAPQLQERLSNIIRNGFDVVVGDANGADKAIQRYFFTSSYVNVKVFHVGEESRNNLGGWPSVRVEGGRYLTGWEHYAQKDKQMAAVADYGLVVWDGESAGSIHNVLELVKNSVIATVFLNPEKSFFEIRTNDDARALLNRVPVDVRKAISTKIRLSNYLGNGESANPQAAFRF
jgi:energy-coupling factor transporter ATP-binding protein EcfA2